VTVGVTWIRETERGQELWFASDSRLSGDGQVWDDCPKLFVSPRRDLAAAFSGDTAQAYPLWLQMANAITSYQSAADGTLELTYLIEHLERVANHMLGRIETDPLVRGAGSPAPFARRTDAIVIGGYSRHANGLIMRALQFDKQSGSWRFVKARDRVKVGSNKVYRIFGDRTAAARYSYLLLERLRSSSKLGTSRSFDLEPLGVLWEFLTLPASIERPLPHGRRPPSTGGPVQVVQVRPGGLAMPFAVRWGSPDEPVYVLGRQAFPEERLDIPLVAREDAGGFVVTARGQWESHRPGDTR